MRYFDSSGHSRHVVTGLLVLILTVFAVRPIGAAADADHQVCNATADYFLGNEDYPETARLHRLFIAEHPNDALAHYHLGYAEGMMGQSSDELDQYQTAVRLGLRDWGLYLNLGRVHLEQGQLGPATSAFQSAVALGPEHAEAHFNLGLAYERQGNLSAAATELTQSLALDPSQSDARNMLAVVDAEQGNYHAAQVIWAELIRSQPNFAPAQANLAILETTLKQRTAGSAALSARSFQSASASGPR
ncbi:MAG TPA: tetratricopeptide repeat protein [Candidatus Binataceae bacterium]|nr:tetratricopeptide repeat protein [Candidatus Binataceae bacterium]